MRPSAYTWISNCKISWKSSRRVAILGIHCLEKSALNTSSLHHYKSSYARRAYNTISGDAGDDQATSSVDHRDELQVDSGGYESCKLRRSWSQQIFTLHLSRSQTCRQVRWDGESLTSNGSFTFGEIAPVSQFVTSVRLRAIATGSGQTAGYSTIT